MTRNEQVYYTLTITYIDETNIEKDDEISDYKDFYPNDKYPTYDNVHETRPMVIKSRSVNIAKKEAMKSV